MSGTRWLDADEQQTWRAFLSVNELLFIALDRQLQRDAGLTHASYIVLAMLSEAPGRCLRMSELATLSNSSQSRLSHTVARLEERGWVQRARSTDDRRGQLAHLTDAGWDVVVATAPGHVEAVRECLFDQLSTQQKRQLNAICEKVLAKLDPDRTFPGRRVPGSS
jgi:DNA-binding MarR family transcriptional regulator